MCMFGDYYEIDDVSVCDPAGSVDEMFPEQRYSLTTKQAVADYNANLASTEKPLILPCNEDSPVDNCEEMFPKRDGDMLAYPCGLIAKSIFNDTFRLEDAAGDQVAINENGIAWIADK